VTPDETPDDIGAGSSENEHVTEENVHVEEKFQNGASKNSADRPVIEYLDGTGGEQAPQPARNSTRTHRAGGRMNL
jgi:hypothetical protein